MEPKKYKAYNKSYFSSSKKQPLVKKMIFDSNQGQAPSSCYELRPIHENQSNQQDIIFDPKSSSLKEISQFEKNSPHELDKIIYDNADHHIQSESLFINCDREGSSNYYSKSQQGNQSSSQIANTVKREYPTSPKGIQQFQKIAKICQVSESLSDQYQHSVKEQNDESLQKKINSYGGQSKNIRNEVKNKNPNKRLLRNYKKRSYLNVNQTPIIQAQESKIENDGQYSYKTQFQRDKQNEVKLQQIEIISSNEGQKSITSNEFKKQITNKNKTIRKITYGSEFQLINQYTQLMSYASLIQDLIAVYGKSPLFQHPLDFDSEPEQNYPQKQQKQNFNSQNSKNLNKMVQQQQYKPQNQVKIQEFSMEEENYYHKPHHQSKLSQAKQKQQLYTLLQKMKIQDAPTKDRPLIIKQINFSHSKTYINFFQPIHQLKPYIKKMNTQQKKLFLSLKKQLKEIKDIFDYFDKKNINQKKQHICKICGEQFNSGRQLGGHMSRKHPGKAFQYVFKRELYKIKEIERNRRKYFKIQRDERDEVKIEHQDD